MLQLDWFVLTSLPVYCQYLNVATVTLEICQHCAFKLELGVRIMVTVVLSFAGIAAIVGAEVYSSMRKGKDGGHHGCDRKDCAPMFS